MSNDQKLKEALDYAIKIIESYEFDVKNLKDYISEGHSIEGFCQGIIYKEAIRDIKKKADIL